MLKIALRLVLLLAVTLPVAVEASDGLVLWYRQPAVEWTEALPVGNGNLPAPGALALLGLAGVAGRRRRRA